MPVPQAIDCIIQAARGLKAAFEASVVHRDIKPSNLLLQPDGTVKILDMGLARLDAVGGALGANPARRESDAEQCDPGDDRLHVAGTGINPRNADHRSDIYSLGCTLHYLITGRPPFSGETLIERLIAHREQPIPSLSDGGLRFRRRSDDLLKRVLAKSPDDRLSSFDELIAGLEACRPTAMTDAWTDRRSPQFGDVPPEPSGKRRASDRRPCRRVSQRRWTCSLAAIYFGRPGIRPSGRRERPPVSVAPAVVKTNRTSSGPSAVPNQTVFAPVDGQRSRRTGAAGAK